MINKPEKVFVWWEKKAKVVIEYTKQDVWKLHTEKQNKYVRAADVLKTLIGIKCFLHLDPSEVKHRFMGGQWLLVNLDGPLDRRMSRVQCDASEALSQSSFRCLLVCVWGCTGSYHGPTILLMTAKHPLTAWRCFHSFIFFSFMFYTVFPFRGPG